MSVDVAAVVSADVWPAVLAVDPGGSHTGIVLRLGTGALEGVTVDRAEGEREQDHQGTPKYARRVLATMQLLVERHRDDIAAEAARRGVAVPPVRVACETLVPPTPRARGGVGISTRVLSALPATAAVMGVVLGAFPSAILVPPHGGARGWDELDKGSYPGVLHGRTPEGWLAGGSERRHQRSAWAVAGAAHLAAPAVAPAPTVLFVPAPGPVPADTAPAPARAQSGDAETPTPERQQQLRLLVSQRVAAAPGGTDGARLGDPLGLLASLTSAVRAADATDRERAWLLARLPQLAASCVADAMRGEDTATVRNVAALVKDQVRQLIDGRAA